MRSAKDSNVPLITSRRKLLGTMGLAPVSLASAQAFAEESGHEGGHPMSGINADLLHGLQFQRENGSNRQVFLNETGALAAFGNNLLHHDFASGVGRLFAGGDQLLTVTEKIEEKIRRTS
jgi:hypothetical protein